MLCILVIHNFHNFHNLGMWKSRLFLFFSAYAMMAEKEKNGVMAVLKWKNTWEPQETLVPNQFIDYYMAQANGECVKVYLYLLRHPHVLEQEDMVRIIADALCNMESDVRRALEYWKKQGVLQCEEVEREPTIYEEQAAAYSSGEFVGTSMPGRIMKKGILPQVKAEESGMAGIPVNPTLVVRRKGSPAAADVRMQVNPLHVQLNASAGTPVAGMPVHTVPEAAISEMQQAAAGNPNAAGMNSGVTGMGSGAAGMASASAGAVLNAAGNAAGMSSGVAGMSSGMTSMGSGAAVPEYPTNGQGIMKSSSRIARAAAKLAEQHISAGSPEKETEERNLPDAQSGILASGKRGMAGKSAKTVLSAEKKTADASQLSSDEEFSQLLYVVQQYRKKPLTPTDCDKFAYLYDELHMSAELLEYVAEYCVQEGYTSVRYMESVALSWHKNGIVTINEAKSYSEGFSKNSFAVMKALGQTGRAPATAEKKLIDKWFQKYGFSKEIVLEACNRTILAIHAPSFEYVDTILTSWSKEKVKTLKDVEVLDEKHKNKKEEKRQNPAEAGRKGQSKRTVSPVNSGNRFNNFMSTIMMIWFGSH